MRILTKKPKTNSYALNHIQSLILALKNMKNGKNLTILRSEHVKLILIYILKIYLEAIFDIFKLE